MECHDAKGNPYFTDDLSRSADSGTVQNALIDACPWFRDAVTVWNGVDYKYSADGIDFIFYFHRYKGEI